jgi:hypothetical protein
MENLEIIKSAFIAEDERLDAEREADILEFGEEFDHGNPFTICTNGAKWLRDNYFPKAVVMGYWIENNPTAEIGQDIYGHDFLLIDNRYILDFWYFHVCGKENAPVFLDMEKDQELVKKYYGDHTKWEPLNAE